MGTDETVTADAAVRAAREFTTALRTNGNDVVRVLVAAGVLMPGDLTAWFYGPIWESRR